MTPPPSPAKPPAPEPRYVVCPASEHLHQAMGMRVRRGQGKKKWPWCECFCCLAVVFLPRTWRKTDGFSEEELEGHRVELPPTTGLIVPDRPGRGLLRYVYCPAGPHLHESAAMLVKRKPGGWPWAPCRDCGTRVILPERWDSRKHGFTAAELLRSRVPVPGVTVAREPLAHPFLMPG